MNKKRLQKLADHLRTVPAKELNMNVWSCGTTACAMGHACEIPAFQRAGLKLESAVSGSFVYPVFKGSADFQAAEKFFGIDSETSFLLFDPDSYEHVPRPATVAKRIESVIAKD